MTPPTSNYDDTPSRQICVNEEWLSHVIGRLWALEKESWWSTDGYDASQQITTLIDQWSNQDCFMLPIGTIQMFGGLDDAIPDTWLKCDGQAVSRSTYSALFDVIGENFGPGNGTTTFNLPDMQSRMPIGEGQGQQLTRRNMGDMDGGEEHNLALDEMPVHDHEIYSGEKYRISASGSGGGIGWHSSGSAGSHRTGPAGGLGNYFSLMNPFTAVNFIIFAGV